MGEVSVMKVGRLTQMQAMLHDRPGIWHEEVAGLDLDENDREGNQDFSIRSFQGKRVLASLVVPPINSSTM